jgi:hypothetical protein
MARLPEGFGFTRDDFEAWQERGMVPRDVALLWLTYPGCYVLLYPPPRRIRGELEGPAPVDGAAPGEGGGSDG